MSTLLGLASRWELWSTSAYLEVESDDEQALNTARAAVFRVMHDVELSASRFRDDSDISRIAAAGGKSVVVSATTIELVRVALRVARLTEGLVDPTVGSALVSLGYDRTIREVRRSPRPSVVLQRSVGGWRDVEVDEERSTVRVPEGIVLDLGATAKAWAADTGAAAAHDATALPVLLGVGGDLAACGSPEGSIGWPVSLAEDPAELTDATVTLPRVALASGGLATSTTLARRWQSGDRWLHHIIDPRTGASAREVWRTATVAAGTCVDANAASAAALIMGEGAVQWLAERGLPARLISSEGEAVAVGDWPRSSL